MSFRLDTLSLLHSSLDVAARTHPSVVAMCGWVVGILSYHQDAKHRLKQWGIVSQIFSITCLVALLVFGFMHDEWWNFLVVCALGWLHIQCTKRWWARPGAWW